MIERKHLVIMGVSGSGKTTIGELIAEKTERLFLDGDDFHPEENVRKMSLGIALSDQDRLPWLTKLKSLLDSLEEKGHFVVLACSALKKKYRDILRGRNVQFVFLKGDYDLILKRLRMRSGHYMPSDLLQSQFDALEPPTVPEDYIEIDIKQPVKEIVIQVVRRL